MDKIYSRKENESVAAWSDRLATLIVKKRPEEREMKSILWNLVDAATKDGFDNCDDLYLRIMR